MNNNQSLIDGLRQAADFLESKPELQKLHPARMMFSVGGKADLIHVARHIGSFTKETDDYHFILHKPFGPALTIDFFTSREAFCKKVVTWDCPEDFESLLKTTNDEAEACERVGAGE